MLIIIDSIVFIDNININIVFLSVREKLLYIEIIIIIGILD